ncbi:MAG: hypothetical protein EXQ88_08035 [Alphaproteobacteria bacterium]|nr:hypothetical protein [Alphaproteobacteria bacterium]
MAADRAANPLLRLDGAAGVLVLPVAGAPGAATMRLAVAMAEALARADMPAGTRAVNAASHQLHGTIAVLVEDAAQTAIELDWRLIDPEGRELGSDVRRETVPRDQWYRADPTLMRRLAQLSARALAALVLGEPPPFVGVAEAAPVRRITVAPVDGAPGDGRTTLQRALAEILRQSGLTVAPAFDGESLILLGTVTASKPERGRQSVEISWALMWPDGSEAGRIDQASQVVAGSLDGAWGEAALDVALGAAEGVRELLRSLPRERVP